MNIGDYDAIISTIGHYLEGARTGRGELMRPAFHDDATIFGYVGADFWAGPIQSLYDWNDKNGPAAEIVSKVVSVDIAETIAVARVESDNWTGLRFSDFFTLMKVGGQWKIMNKVFHLHA
nr:nuclear transport factor 2 family protein [Sinorhizobium sp. 7-81]